MKRRTKQLLIFAPLVAISLVTIGVINLYNKRVKRKKVESDPSIPPLEKTLDDLGNLTKS